MKPRRKVRLAELNIFGLTASLMSALQILGPKIEVNDYVTGNWNHM
jgi:hypothetical protein